MNSDTLLGIAAIGAVGIGGLIAWRMLDPNRQRVAYAPGQQVPYPPGQPALPPSQQPALPPSQQPALPAPAPTPQPPVAPPYYPPPQTLPPTTPPPTPTVTKGQLCSETKANLQKLQSLADDVRKKLNDLVAKGSSADVNCWSYAKREACFWEICSPALGGNYDACMKYVKGEGPRPANLFNFDDSRAVDAAAQEYKKLKDELATYETQIEALRKQLTQLASEGVVC